MLLKWDKAESDLRRFFLFWVSGFRLLYLEDSRFFVFTLMYLGRLPEVSDSAMLDFPVRSDFSMESPFVREVGRVVLRWDMGMIVVWSDSSSTVNQLKLQQHFFSKSSAIYGAFLQFFSAKTVIFEFFFSI